MAIEDEYQDVLQNIEVAIIDVHRRGDGLVDYDVEDALDALIADYKAEQQGRPAKPHRLGERSERVYTAVKRMCEWRLGREQQLGDGRDPEPLTLAEMEACLKRLKKSVQRWDKRGGRTGYLDFIGQFL